MHEYRHQPWKALFIASQLALLFFAQIPWCILTNLLPSSRPSPKWTMKRVLVVRFVQSMFKWFHSIASVSTHQAIKPGKGFIGVWVKAIPHLLLGEIKEAAEKNGVSSVRIPGYWIHKDGLSTIKAGAPPVPGEKVVYCFHGGAYISLSAHPTDFTAAIAKGILKHAPNVTRAFSIEYRLSRAAPYEPQGAFPSALIDAVAGYDYLVNEVGFDPKDIIVEGDSAGGNLALALTRYLIEYASHDPSNPLPGVPGSVILLSPWTDMGSSHDMTPNTRRNTPIDYLGYRPEISAYIIKAFASNLGPELTNSYRYFSPGSSYDAMKEISFRGYPRTFIVAGGLEMMHDQIDTLQKRMKSELGGEHVTYYLAPDAVHDYVTIPPHEPEKSETLIAIAKWLSTI